MAVDLYTVTPRDVERARAEVTRLEGRWGRYGFAKMDLARLVRQEEAVSRLAGELAQERRQLARLTGDRRRRLGAVKWLGLLLRLGPGRAGGLGCRPRGTAVTWATTRSWRRVPG